MKIFLHVFLLRINYYNPLEFLGTRNGFPGPPQQVSGNSHTFSRAPNTCFQRFRQSSQRVSRDPPDEFHGFRKAFPGDSRESFRNSHRKRVPIIRNPQQGPNSRDGQALVDS